MEYRIFPRAAVPNLFGTRDWFCGRQFFHGQGGWGGDGAGDNVSDGERQMKLCLLACCSPPAGGPSSQQAMDQYRSEAWGFGTPALKDISLEIFFKNM